MSTSERASHFIEDIVEADLKAGRHETAIQLLAKARIGEGLARQLVLAGQPPFGQKARDQCGNRITHACLPRKSIARH